MDQQEALLKASDYRKEHAGETLKCDYCGQQGILDGVDLDGCTSHLSFAGGNTDGWHVGPRCVDWVNCELRHSFTLMDLFPVRRGKARTGDAAPRQPPRRRSGR